MAEQIFLDSFAKKFLRKAWQTLVSLHVIASRLTCGGGGTARVFYGGARSGNLGGPLVKVKRLLEYFPQNRWKYNLIYLLSNAPYLSLLALKLISNKNIPTVLNQNGVFFPGWYGGDWKKMNLAMANSYHRADYVFWQSNFCRRAADHFLGKREGPGEILFNAVDTKIFKPANSRPERPFTFLLTGRIDAHLTYRIETSLTGIKVARECGLDCRLLVAGWVHPYALDIAKQLVHKLRLVDHVDFLGQYTQEIAPSVYQSADAYIITKYLDPCPNTVLEAMACGLPVLYSASGGVPEQVGKDAGVGLQVEENWEGPPIVPSTDAIASGMLEIYAKSNKMSVAARLRAENNFEITHWVDRHAQVFQMLLDTKC